MSETTDRRLDRLEENQAHGDVTLATLSDELAKQWQVIERQNRVIAELKEKIESLEAAGPESPEGHRPPPHY